MLSFSEFKTVGLINEIKTGKAAVITFGRFNPITSGHEKVINTVTQWASSKRADALIFPSQSQDPKKNPLLYKDKVKYMKQLFPKAKIINDLSIKNVFYALKMLSEAGYKDVTLVVGSDRVEAFDSQIRKYIKHPDASKTYDFDDFKVINAGEREGAISASLMRQYAKDDDFEAFKKGLPSTATKNIATAIFNDVRKGMKIT